MINPDTPALPATFDVDQTFQQALELHQAGQYLDAERLYHVIVQYEPQHPMANHNLGVLAVQMKQPAAGLPFFMAALDADPSRGQYWISYIDALYQAGQLEDARDVLALAKQQGLEGNEVDALELRIKDENRESEQIYEEPSLPFETPLPASSAIQQALTEQPIANGPSNSSISARTPNQHEINALMVLLDEGRLSEAATLAHAMTVRFPLHDSGWKALGVALSQMGRSAEALEPMQRAAVLSPDDAEAHNNLGITLQHLGRLVEAEASYRRAIQINPNYSQAHNSLGITLQHLGRQEEAEASYRRALQINPDYPQAYNSLGITLQNFGRFEEAEDCFRQALKNNPVYAEAHNNLGITLQKLGRPDEAEASYRQAIKANPNYAQAFSNLGAILQQLGRLDEAIASYQQAIQIDPGYAKALSNLGAALKDKGRINEAEASCRQAIKINPELAEAYNNLGITLKEMRRFDEAEACYRRGIKINPDFAEAYNNLGITLKEMGRLDEAKGNCKHALLIKPDFFEALNNLSIISLDLFELNEAEAYSRRALLVNPDNPQAYNTLGCVLQKRGLLDDAATCFRRTLQIKPDFVDAHCNLIFTMDMMIGEDISSLQEERKRWDATHASRWYQQWTHLNVPNPARKLRIGYVSADFKFHSAPMVFGSMLTSYDRSEFEVYAYSNVKGQGDRSTELFKQSVGVWRDIAGISDDAAADLIRNDQIDILVDLSGYTLGNRLLVFARKPAPIQVTAWGYASGTGMRAMDVFFTDPVMVPPQDKKYFAEEIRYLPCVVGSFSFDPYPEVNELPALSSGAITFGSLNRLSKITEDAYRTWIEILLAIPGSRLILKVQELSETATRDRILERFTLAGVAAERIIMLGGTAWHEHMQTHHQIDIALDPFPHGGGVTSLESLMMGVPVVTLLWPTMAGRVTASIMTALGLPDWIAKSREQYIELAIQKARDLQSLAALRKQLRSIFTSSVMGDQVAYTRAVEQEYRKLWIKWCEKAPSKKLFANVPSATKQ